MPPVFPKILVVPGLPQDIRVILPLRSIFDASNGEELRKEVFRIASSAFEFLISISGLVVAPKHALIKRQSPAGNMLRRFGGTKQAT